MDQVKQNTYGVNSEGVFINNLQFADDIHLIDEDISTLQQQVELTRTTAEQSGLILNTNKTKIIVFESRNIEIRIQVTGGTMKNVEKFEYFGSLITWNNNCSDEIKRRIGKSTETFGSLKNIWNNKRLRMENKLKTLTTCVFSTLLYASETWTLKEADRKKLLPMDAKNQWSRHDTKRRHPKEDIEK